ncbi:MAG: ABC transporter ATP-binding protein [Kiritimatiellia bacterium]
MAKRKEYRREFFDREYAAREAYARLWAFAGKFRARIFFGLFCGLLSAGALLPFYQMVQPAVAEVPMTAADVPAAGSGRPRMAKALDRAARLPGWFVEVEKVAGKAGISVASEDGGLSGAMLLIVFLVLPAVCGFRVLMVFLNHYCLTSAVTKATAAIRVKLLEHVQRQSMQFHGRVDVGQLMSRMTADPNQLARVLPVILAELAIAPFEIAFSLFFIVSFAIRNGLAEVLLILLVAVPAFVLPIAALGRKMRKWTKRSLERSSVIGSDVHEVLTCVRTVKAYHTEELENGVFRKVYDHLNKSVLRALRLGLLTGPLVESIGIALIGAALIGCFALQIPLMDFLPLLAPALMVYRPIKELSKLQVQIQDSMAGLSRIFSLLDCHMELAEPPVPAVLPAFRDAVRFEDVVFTYDTADAPAVDHVSFELKRGQMVAVVGATGSGKSTLGALLSRFHDPQAGRITIDGVDIRSLAPSAVHRLVGVVPQETSLFNDTIEANIGYGLPGATREQIVAAAQTANAYDFIMAQPEGFSRKCGEKGFALSGGERQRLAIARAILRNPPILVLDEATSALDTVTEHLVQQALENLMRNRTVFSIAHRLSTVRHADRILVMDRGRIVESGTHDELLALKGVYSGLCAAQTSG